MPVMVFPWGEVVPRHQSFVQSAFYNQNSHQITKKLKVISYQENFGQFLVTGFGIPNEGQGVRYQGLVIALLQDAELTSYSPPRKWR